MPTSKKVPELKEGRVEGPVKCRPPVGLKERWCLVLNAVLMPESNERRSGVSVYQGIMFKGPEAGELKIFGVGARRSAKERPVFFNFCPFCGEKIDWYFRNQKRKARRK